MKPILKPTIICKECKRVLEDGDSGGEIKSDQICYKCVIKTTKGAPKDRLLTPQGQPLGSLGDAPAFMNRKERRAQKPPNLTLCYQWFPPDEHNIEEHLRWIIKAETYEKKTLMSVTFSRGDLLEVIKDMEGYEDERRLDEAGITPSET